MISFSPFSRMSAGTIEYTPGWQLRNELEWTPLRASEVRLSANYYPLCARLQRGRWTLGAIIHDDFQHDPHVGPDGSWLGAYIPLSLRCYPIRLADVGADRPEEDIEIGTSTPTDGPRQVLRIREHDGTPSADLKRIHEGLLAMRADEDQIGAMLDLLAVAGLLAPFANTDKYLTVDASRFGHQSGLGLSAMVRRSIEPVELAVALIYSQRNLRDGIRPLEKQKQDKAPGEPGPSRELAIFDALNYRLDDSELYSADWLESLGA